jgi:hypothetical protein
MKLILPLLILLVVNICVHGQQWSLGGRAGVTFSNYKTKTPWKEVTNLGFDAGIIGFKQINSHIGLNLELHYIQKGYYHKICNSITDELKANYVEVPVMVDYAFIIPSLQNFKAHVNLGLYTAYWVSGTYKMKGFDATSEQFDFSKSHASRFDVGPGAGGRIEYILKNGSLSLDFRYEMGLIDLQKQAQDNTRNTNRAMVVGLSYLKLLH